jgi:hypothetical protein
VWHLGCLTGDVPTGISHPVEDNQYGAPVRSVAEKVTRARILRDKIRGGCPAGVHKEE